jgi:chromosome partitioning protein
MKGGVGKTTLAAQLSHAAAKRGLRTLAIDLDPQANLSQSLLTAEKYVKYLRNMNPTIVQIFDKYAGATDEYSSPRHIEVGETIIRNVGYRLNTSLDLIPSRLELSRTLKNPTGKERRLAKALSKIAHNYDLVLIDCAPTESILTEAAYFASRYVVVPVKPEFLATVGLPLLARSIDEFKLENGDHELDICGIVFVHSSTYSDGPEGNQAIREVKGEARKNRWNVFANHVPYSASYAKAAREGTPIEATTHVRWWVGTDFNKVVEEFFKKIKLAK